MSFTELGTLATGLYDFEGVREDNLPFKKGEVITIIEMSDSGWWKGSNAEGRVGIFPYNYVQARDLEEEGKKQYRIVKAIADCFEVPNEDYLQFKNGDLITVLKPFNDDWSIGKIPADLSDPTSVTREGKFPLNFVEETGMVDDSAAREENEKYERMEREKQEEAERLQRERAEIEKAARIKYEEEQRKAKEEAEELKRLKKLEQEAKERQEQERLLALKEEKERNERKERERIEREQKLEKERLEKLKKEEESRQKLLQEKEEEDARKLEEENADEDAKQEEIAADETAPRPFEIMRQASAAEAMLEDMRKALAEQEEQLKKIREQKEELERKERERRAQQAKLLEEAEAARKRAEKAEMELQSARAEQERLKKMQQQIDAAKSTAVAADFAAQKLKVAEKANKSYINFQTDDGFISPPPPPEAKPRKLSFELDFEDNEIKSQKSHNTEVTLNESSKAKPIKRASVANSEPRPSPADQMANAMNNFREMTKATPSNEEMRQSVNANGRKKKGRAVQARFSKLGGAEKCKKCGKTAGFGPDSIRALESMWHIQCFTCATCSKVLRQGEYVDNKGFPYCMRCHKTGFGIKGFGFGGAIAGNYK